MTKNIAPAASTTMTNPATIFSLLSIPQPFKNLILCFNKTPLFNTGKKQLF
jgi:hypothetical protein